MSAAGAGLHSRERLMRAAKALFARLGFEHTPTAAIARQAGTSESQLVRYFGTKNGLLEAIFNDSWHELNGRVQSTVAGAKDAREALVGVLDTVTGTFGADPELAYLLLFEGRRIRGSSPEIKLSDEFVEFEKLILVLVQRGKKDGTFRTKVSDSAIASALIGAAEGMVRDRLMAQRAHKEVPFGDRDVRQIFGAFIDALGDSRPSAPREEPKSRIR